MYIKKSVINNKEILLFKSKTNGVIYIDYNSLSLFFEFNSYQKKNNLKKLIDLKLILTTEIQNKSFNLFPLEKNKIFNELIKNIKSKEHQDLILLNKKGLYTKCKNQMKAFLPEVIIESLVKNKISSYFNKLEDIKYYENFNIINSNLYSLNSLDKIDLNKKILKVTNRRNKLKTIKEVTYLKVSKDIELMLSKEEIKKANKKIKSISNLKIKLEKEKEKKELELEKQLSKFDYFISSKYLFSYNKALIAAYTNKLVTNPKYKSWKDSLTNELKKTSYFKYIINDKIFDFIKKNKIELFLKIYIYISPEYKEKEFLPDNDNYIKPFQDALSSALGIDDKYFNIKNFEFIEVKCYEEQGYYFGLQKQQI